MISKIKIGFVSSPLNNQNKVRGVGYYTKKLYENLSKIKTLEVNLIKNWNLKIENYDLIHYPFFDPFNLTLKIFKQPTVVTVHDLIPLQFKKHFPAGFKGNLKWLIQLYHLRRAAAIITVSQYSKKIIHQITHIPLNKIFVTYLAADSTFKPINNKSYLQAIKAKYHLPDKFVLFVGDINWNKNIPSLVKICQHLNYPLVIAGSAAVQKNVPIHPWTKDLLWLQQQKYPLKLGFVPETELPALFNLATIYCQPSYAEGFGLPPLQAMACGCPVICRMATSLPEVVGSAALPFSIDSFQKFWQEKKIREKYIKLGLDQAKNFAWEKTARATMEVYVKINS